MFMQCIAIFSHEIYLKRRIDAAFFEMKIAETSP